MDSIYWKDQARASHRRRYPVQRKAKVDEALHFLVTFVLEVVLREIPQSPSGFLKSHISLRISFSRDGMALYRRY